VSLPIRVRLTLWYVLLLAAILSALSVFLVLRLHADLVRGVDASLSSRAAQISLGLQSGGEGEFRDISDRALRNVVRSESAAQLLTITGQVSETSGDPVAARPMIGRDVLAQTSTGPVRLTIVLGPDHESFRLLVQRLPTGRGVLVVADGLEGVERSVHSLILLLLVAGPVAVAVAGGGGFLLARSALRPVARMTGEAAAIGVERLDERVAVPRTRDELHRLATTLNAMLERLEQGVADKRRFVADASHELRTPLAVMRAELEVGLQETDLSQEARDVLGSSVEEVDRMARIVDNLLTLARIDEGKLRLLRTDVSLSPAIATVVDELTPMARSRGVRLLRSAREGDGPSVVADAERLHQVLLNLLENAIKYTDPGGEVTAQPWTNGSMAGVTVRDSGRGIPTDEVTHVFERFYRVGAARSRDDGGSGLGLAICHEIIEAHGGQISVRSEPGRGSEFTFSLPRA
jgi:heavy metal sensor kinase